VGAAALAEEATVLSLPRAPNYSTLVATSLWRGIGGPLVLKVMDSSSSSTGLSSELNFSGPAVHSGGMRLPEGPPAAPAAMGSIHGQGRQLPRALGGFRAPMLNIKVTNTSAAALAAALEDEVGL
jgi:hypothetical protein